jgi:hypothetical protein
LESPPRPVYSRLPYDANGFLPVDDHGRTNGLSDFCPSGAVNAFVKSLLLTGDDPVGLRDDCGDRGVTDWEAAWWLRAKVAIRRLSPFLAEHANLAADARR